MICSENKEFLRKSAENLDNIYNWMYGRRRKNALHRTFLLYAGKINMRFTIDTEIDRIIVPDTFFNQIDERNAVFEEHGGKDVKKIACLVFISLYRSVLRGNLLTNATRELPTSLSHNLLLLIVLEIYL